MVRKHTAGQKSLRYARFMRTVELQVHYEEGSYVAVGHEDLNNLRFSIIAEGTTWDALKLDVREVVTAIYFDTPKPDRITLHLVHDEELQVA